MNIEGIQTAGKAVIDLLAEYHRPANRERFVDPILYAYLAARYENVTRQHCVYLYGSRHPQRIDFRVGGTNPVVLEFALRGKEGGSALSGPQNTTELRKLCRVKQTQARLRALLLLDLSKSPWKKEALERTYRPLHAGQGRFKRNSVRVVYVHHRESFTFLWSPYRPV